MKAIILMRDEREIEEVWIVPDDEFDTDKALKDWKKKRKALTDLKNSLLMDGDIEHAARIRQDERVFNFPFYLEKHCQGKLVGFDTMEP